MYEEIDNILTKYFTGEASAQELKTLDKWLAESEAHEEYFHQMTFAFQQAGFASDDKPNTKEALLNFRKYIYKRKSSYFPLSVAAGILILLGFALWSVWDREPENRSSNNLVYHTPGYIVLTDSTKVYLWEGSSLKISKEYNIENREIYLTGKASFDIGTGQGKLLIYTKDVVIEDIGTVFTVNTLDTSFVKVIVESGNVIVHPLLDMERSMELEEDEIGIYEKQTGLFNKYTFQSYREPVSFVFHASKLSEVIDVIAKHYEVNILLDNKELNERKITVTFTQENIGTIMEIIASTLNVQCERKGNTYIVSKD